MAETSSVPMLPQEQAPNSAYVVYLPHDLKYSVGFEDEIMTAVTPMGSPPSRDGIRILPEESNEQPEAGVSIRAADISFLGLPAVQEDELPLALDDSRRIFASPIRGLKLTHPGGYFEGGPGLDPEEDTFAEDFLSRNAHLRTPAQLSAARDKEIEDHKGDLVQRMRARRQAVEKNLQIEKDLEKLKERHAMERKVNQKQAEVRREKKANKERRKAEREAVAAG